MPLRCVQRPNRSSPRHWTARNAISACCSAISHGATRSELFAGIEKCGATRAREDEAQEESVEQAMSIALEALHATDDLLILDAQFLERFLFATSLVSLAWRLISRIPVVGIAVTASITALRKIAVTRMERTIARKAANDAVYTRIKRVLDERLRSRRTGTHG